MVGVLDSGSSSPGFEPWPRHCFVFLGKTLHSHSASFHPNEHYKWVVRSSNQPDVKFDVFRRVKLGKESTTLICLFQC